MLSTNTQKLVQILAEDALFIITGIGVRALEECLRLRMPAYEAIAQGNTQVHVLADGESWWLHMATICAAVEAPWFVPMHEVINEGMTFQKTNQGLRAFFSFSRTWAQERVRVCGTFATRVLRCVCSADGVLSEGERVALELFLASLNLPEEDVRILRTESVIPVHSLEIPKDLDPRLIRAILAGAWYTAASDGVDEAERRCLFDIASRMGVEPTAIEAACKEAELLVEAQRKNGFAQIDAIRYVVAPLPSEQIDYLIRTAIGTSLPPMHQSSYTKILSKQAPTPLGQVHSMDKTARQNVLAAAWAIALSANPTYSMQAMLSVRHDRVAADLGALRAGKEARVEIDEILKKLLSAAIGKAGG